MVLKARVKDVPSLSLCGMFWRSTWIGVGKEKLIFDHARVIPFKHLYDFSPFTSHFRLPTNMDLEKLRADLKDHAQEHTLKFWDVLDEEQKARFYDDLRSIDLAKTNRSFTTTMENAENHTGEKKDERIKPIPPEQIGNVSRAGKDLKIWEERGLREIGESKAAVLLLAGGQGTRLGVPYPKGMYDVGLPSHKTLYQLQAERIVKLQELASKVSGKKCIITW